jgi:hypothetical protein
MQLYQRKDRLWISATKPTFGCNPEFRDDLLCSRETFDCTGNAIAQMDEPDVKLRSGMQAQVLQRSKISLVVTVPGDRHMDPRDWTLDLGGKAVRQFDHKTHVGRLDKVLVSWVAVAKMYA